MTEWNFAAEDGLAELSQTVLIVEDEVLVRDMTAEFLRIEGFQVLEAADVAEAKRLLQADHAAIDFVLTDIHLPGAENGLDLARHIRQRHPSIPVLIVSANPGNSKLDGEFLSKPFDLTRLVSVVRALLFTGSAPT